MKRFTHRRGFLMMDVIVGTVMAVALLMAMTVAIVRQYQAERRLALVRTATRRMETAFLSMQSGQSPEESLVVNPLDAPAPAGWTWVRLTLRSPASGNTALPPQTLVGLVPTKSLPAISNPAPLPAETTPGGKP